MHVWTERVGRNDFCVHRKYSTNWNFKNKRFIWSDVARTCKWWKCRITERWINLRMMNTIPGMWEVDDGINRFLRENRHIPAWTKPIIWRLCTYRVIHKSLRDFRPLRYSSRDGHAEGEHVNRGRDTPSFCPTLQVLDMLTSESSWQTFLAHARQSRPMAPSGLFVSQRTCSHFAGILCTTHELFCP